MCNDPLRSTLDVYRQLFVQSAMAVAIHEIVLDEAGRPVDFVFLDANAAYEVQTGLRVSEIIGRRGSDVLSGSRDALFIDICGRVVQSGVAADFESYSSLLDRYFAIHAFHIGNGCFATTVTNATERKQAEQKKFADVDRLRIAVQASHDVIWEYSVADDLKISYAGGGNAFGWDTGVDHPRTSAWWMDRVHPDDRERVKALLAAGLADRACFDLTAEYRFEQQDGCYAYIRDRCQIVRDPGGLAIRLIGAMQDHTAQRQAEDALGQSESLFRRVFENHAVVKLLIDPVSGVIQDANHAAADFYGWSREQLRRTRIQDINVLDSETIKHEMENVVGCKRTFFEFRHRLADGRIRDVEVYSSDVGSSGKPLLHSIIRDVTESREIARQRQRLQAQFVQAQNMASLGSWEYDVDGDKLTWSDETYRIFGMQPHEFKESLDAFQAVVHPDDREAVVAAYLRSLEDTGCAYDIEHRILRRDNGKIRYVHERCSHQRRMDGTVERSFGMVQDITERKRLEEEIRCHRDQLEDRVAERTRQLQQAINEHQEAIKALAESEAYSNALFASIPDPIFVLDREGRFLDCKVHREDRLLMPMARFMNRRFHEILPPTVAEPFQVHLAETFIAGACRFEYSLEIGGKPRFYEASLTRMDSGRALVLVHDITSGMQREMRIQEQAGLIHSLLDSIPDIIFFKDRNGVYMGCNPPFEAFVGRTRDQIIGRTDYDLFSRDVADAFREKDKLMLDCNEPRHNDEWITYPDGRSILIDTLKTPYKGADGERIGILGISRDITGRYRAELHLREQERLYHSLVESQHDMIVRVDLSNRFTFVNDAYCQMFGKTREELIGREFAPLVHPDDLDATMCALGGLHSTPYRITFEQRAMTGDGWRWISWEDSAILDDNGAVIEIQGVGRDITDLKQAVMALSRLSRIQEHLMRLATGLINVPVTGHDAAINQALGAIGALIDADRAYLMSYDFETGLICNTHEWCNAGITPQIDDLQAVPMADVPEWVAAHTAGKETLVASVSALSPEDSLRQILEPQGIQSLITLPLTGESQCLGFIGFDAVRNQRDWTDEERGLLRILAEIFANFETRSGLEQRLTTARDHAEAANRAKSEFLASMSHELRTPLNAVIGFAEAVEDPFYGDLNEKQRLYIGHIREAGQHLLELINEVLDLSKVEAGGMELDIAPVDIGKLLESSLSMISERCRHHGVSLALDIAPELDDGVIEADARKMRQILYNLLSNAAKFTPDGGRITVEAVRIGGEPVSYVEVRVTDTGIGFSPEHGERIFEPFFQVVHEGSGKTPGTGLGLPLTRQFVELHGGTLRVESDGRGKGCRAVFRIPSWQVDGTRADGEGAPE